MNSWHQLFYQVNIYFYMSARYTLKIAHFTFDLLSALLGKKIFISLYFITFIIFLTLLCKNRGMKRYFDDDLGILTLLLIIWPWPNLLSKIVHQGFFIQVTVPKFVTSWLQTCQILHKIVSSNYKIAKMRWSNPKLMIYSEKA